jgi:hypothetical protein
MGHNRNLADYAHHFDGTNIDLGSGNIETEGVLTYEDVTNVDAIGIITARAGVKVPDSQNISLGTGNDFAITHDGTNTTFINDTGQIQIRNRADDQDIILQTDDGSGGVAVYLRCDGSSGQVDLNHYGSRKFYTSSTGATVNGTLVSDGVTSELDLSAISASISDTATDIFVYDTRKDSDGGAWRKRTQHTSWYNETLNTSTRGSRKEFPAVAVIVTETSQVTIYDGDDPDLPMWMVFNAGSGNALWYNNGAKATVMLNGKLANAAGGGNQRFRTIDFLSDSHIEYSHTDGRTTFNINISQRNAGAASSFNYGNVSGSGLISRDCNDVAMTVLPNAPIDDATGLPIPTIAVATNAGVSVIKDDGTVYDVNDNSGTRNTFEVLFRGDTLTWNNTANGTIQNKWNIGSISADSYGDSGGVWRYNYNINGGDSLVENVSAILYGNNRLTAADSSDPQKLFIGSNGVSSGGDTEGLTFILDGNDRDTDYSGHTITDSMVAYATTSYNTGYMHGDIKGAFLSDTDTTNVSADTLNSANTFDGTFATSTGWTADSDWTISGGVATCNGNNSGRFIYPTNDRWTVGSSVVVEVTVTAYTSGTLNVSYSSGGATSGTSMTATGTYKFLNNVSVNDLIYLRSESFVGSIDNVKIYYAEYDRSVNNKGLIPYGTITKSVVATGADLVAYSGFSASNHLRQPPNSDMNIGTGDAYEMIWFKTVSGGSTEMLISYEGGANGTSDYGKPFNIRYENGSVRGWASHNGFTTHDDVNHGVSTADGQWHCAAWVKRGQVFELYIDGEFIGSDTGAVGGNALSDANSELVIGGRKRGLAPGTCEEPFAGSLALARIGKSAPSAEQVKKMYEDEKHLFQENADCTLYGSSDAVTALGYDEDTELLHVGTSAGRSDFQGLRRINNTTTAVTTAISASDELIAEQ